MNPKQEQNVRTVARWLEVVNDINGEPLMLIAETTHNENHRLHIFSLETISVPTALAILKDTLEQAVHHAPDLDIPIAPRIIQ